MQKLITIDVSADAPEGLGALRYETHPRIGEWIERDIDGVGVVFEVVMVAHSTVGGASDIYVRRIGESSEAVRQLCQRPVVRPE